jgi:hypothetical protein
MAEVMLTSIPLSRAAEGGWMGVRWGGVGVVHSQNPTLPNLGRVCVAQLYAFVCVDTVCFVFSVH